MSTIIYLDPAQAPPRAPSPTVTHEQRMYCRQIAASLAARVPLDPVLGLLVLSYLEAIYGEFILCPAGEDGQ